MARVLAAAAALATALALAAAAQEGPSPSRFSLDDRGLPGVLGTASALPLHPGEMSLTLGASAKRSVDLLRNARLTYPGGERLTLTDIFLASSQAALAVGLGHGFDAGLSLPYYYGYLPEAGNPEETGVGDLSFDVRVGRAFLPWLGAALTASGALPTSSPQGLLPRSLAFHPAEGGYPDAATHPFGTAKPRGGAGGALTIDFSPWLTKAYALVHLDVAGERVLFADQDGLGLLEASLAAEGGWGRFGLSGEYRHEKLIADLFGDASSPGHANTLSAAMSASYAGFSLRLGGTFAPKPWNPYLSLRAADGARFAYKPYPEASAFAAISWQGFPLHHDQDNDGIPDRSDGCPFRPEDRDGFEDADGCPDLDNDRDGVPDSADRCPFAAEDHDGFQDEDGCPEADNDRDGIPDSLDACVNDAEDRDGFQDNDGCPDLDNDRDGIPDASDRCPDQPEDRNGFEDADGCPEPDTDKDGIPDKIDRCPNDPEIVNFYQDQDGCPDERPEPVRSAILGEVSFKPGTAELDASSYPALDSLASLMIAYPGTEIEIQGHLDNQTPQPKALSEAMASSVAGYLAHKGVEPRRMKPAGYGETRPIGSNRTAHGRQANRRIEIVRLN